ncbi:MAG: hypothetical protein HKN58_06060 [Xanthomonadales bacterium]|nr:hypothetical protein [Xanthomonadales bacterium]
MKSIALGSAWLGAVAFAFQDERPRVTVSGISSGGYMAVQAHVALSGTVGGAAVLAGGPYHCAEGQISRALGPCISGSGLDSAPLVDAARAFAELSAIDPLANLGDDRVWLFLGQQDPVVQAGVNGALASFYGAFVPGESVRVIEDVPVTHGWPTLDQGNDCAELGTDFINACDYDAAGELLAYLYGPLNPRASAVGQHLQRFDQGGIAAEASGLAEAGFAYVPAQCVDKPAQCRLHLVFHGCRQGEEFIGDRFVTRVGLNEWAESNSTIVLYPQVAASPLNPQGCWDWWGYTGEAYDHRGGLQLQFVARLIGAWSE